MNDIIKQNEKIAKARRLLLEEDIEPADYKEIKADCDAVIARLEVKLQEASETKMVGLDINKLMDKIITRFCNLDKVFQKAPLKIQRHILCSLFPKKSTLTEPNIEHLGLILSRM
jgi:site-specific DNA recombinase